MVTKERPEVWSDYLALVEAFPLESVHDDEHLTQALRVFEVLIKKSINQTLSEGEGAYYLALSDLIETYEDAQIPSGETVSGVELLRTLMEENGLTAKDLVPIFGARSIVSDVLSGKRGMTVAQSKALAERFRLSADAFVDRPTPARTS
jgi:HTH-type transcriptional regulator/antitoxin HigA